MTKLPEVTEENYYSNEMALAYCGASQYKDFFGCPAIEGCPARAMARIRGDFDEEPSLALKIGSAVDLLWEFDGDMQKILPEHPEYLSTKGQTKGQLKSEFRQAQYMYDRTASDELFKSFMSGEKQVIMTGAIEGLPFKIKIDSYAPGNFICDLKTTQDLHKYYYFPDLGAHATFIEAYDYGTQLAIYREIVRQNTGENLPCYIAAIDKTSEPDFAVIRIPDGLMDGRLEDVKRNAYKVIEWKSGEIDVSSFACGHCDWCKRNKKLDRIITPDDLKLDLT